MDVEVLKSYLVSLGFAVNAPELRKFELGLKDASGLVQSATSGVVRDLFKWQFAATSAFVGVSTAVIGMVDHVASADQKYRLLGLRMFMTTQQARSMQMSLDSLGATLEDVIWDPELKARYIEQQELQKRLASQLGASFEANMRSVRDLKGEIAKLGIEFEYLSMAFVSSLVVKFKPEIDAILAKFKEWGEYLATHLPEWADFFAENFVPVLRTTWEVLKDLGLEVRGLVTDFTNLIGLLTGDSSIEGTEFNFRKLAGAIQHVVAVVGGMLVTMSHATRIVVHFAGAIIALLTGNFKGAKAEALSAFALLGPDAGALVGGLIGTLIEPGIGTAAGAAIGAGLGGAAALARGTDSPAATSAATPLSHGDGSIADAITQKALGKGLNPILARAIAMQESGMRQYDASGRLMANPASSARGIFQLLKGTAAGLGVDASDQDQNIDGGVRYLAQLVKHYNGSEERAIAAYYWGQGNVDKSLAQGKALPTEVQNYVRGVQSHEAQGDVTIGSVSVHIMQPNASAKEIQDHVVKAIATATKKETQRNVAQLAYVG